MNYNIEFVESAQQDILGIYKFIARNNSIERAEKIFNEIIDKCLSLNESPKRGKINPELSNLGVNSYREIQSYPYRIIYRILGQKVFIHYVIDGRRDVQSLMEEKFLK